MKLAAILFACLLATSASAASLVARKPSTTLTLTDKPCTSDAVKENIHEEFHERYKAVSLLLHGKHYVGCWTHADEKRVFIIMETGEAFTSPYRIFKLDEGV